MVARRGFEPRSPDPKSGMIVRYTTGLPVRRAHLNLIKFEGIQKNRGLSLQNGGGAGI